MDSELVIDYNSSTTITYKDIEETGKTTEDELMENEIRAAGQSKKSPNRPSLGINTSLLDDIEELEDGGRPRANSEAHHSPRVSPRHRANTNIDNKTDNEQFDFWYPSWETWKFRRTLSYWIAVMFLEGSMLFVIGAAFSMAKITKNNERYEKALVVTPYFIGGLCFTVGAYAGVLEVINIHNKD